MPHPRPTVFGSSSSLWRPIAHPTPPPTSAPPVAPIAVYSFCSGVHDEHDETVKSATVAKNTDPILPPIHLQTLPEFKAVLKTDFERFCHFSRVRSIQSRIGFGSSSRTCTQRKGPQPWKGLRPVTDVYQTRRPTRSAPARRDGSERDPRPCRWWRRSQSCRSRAESTGSTGYRLSPGSPRRHPHADRRA